MCLNILRDLYFSTRVWKLKSDGYLENETNKTKAIINLRENQKLYNKVNYNT